VELDAPPLRCVVAAPAGAAVRDAEPLRREALRHVAGGCGRWAAAVAADGAVFALAAAEDAAAEAWLVRALSGRGVTRVAAGAARWVAVAAGGEVWQVGASPPTASAAAAVAEPVAGLPLPAVDVAALSDADSCFALLSDGSVWAWGSNGGASGLLGTGDKDDHAAPARVALPEGFRATQVAAGARHAAALSAAGEVAVWGDNAAQQLGLGDKKPRPSPTLVPRFAAEGDSVAALACGASHTAALTARGRLFTWGSGAGGALGHGDRKDARAPRAVEYVDQVTLVAVAAGRDVTVARSADDELIVVSAPPPAAGESREALLPRTVEAAGLPVRAVAAAGAAAVALLGAAEEQQQQQQQQQQQTLQ
jgi:hypothetical protein